MMDHTEPTHLLAQAGLRVTAIRTRTLATILGAGRSLSHGELVGILGDIDRITLFRTLKSLKAAGIVHAIRGIDGVQRYLVSPGQGTGCPGRHPHFLCLACGRMICLIGQELPHIELPEGTLVSGKQYLVYGHCPECAASAQVESVPAALPDGESTS